MFSLIERSLLYNDHVRTAVAVQNTAKVTTALCPLYWYQIYRIQADVADIQNADRLEQLQKLNGKLSQKEKKSLEDIRTRIAGHERA
ncbi:hypothetical protein PISL3812_07357 [Talaromyces islandicus]|uniref:Uncharacterized protein n=1 Tax=Talaromyces islandicus TaxID=28573 RepID=A0A0U1M464_TALIS|nr:hypothetical protein PISL3812_07357 [Talaromyces islandicus]